jgi:Major Facilitator Superfamily
VLVGGIVTDLLAVGAAVLAAFVVIEGRAAQHPLAPLSLFRRRALSAANAVAITIGAAQFGTYVFLSLYLQRTLGYSPLQSGLAVLPAGISTMTGSLLGARVLARLGLRRQLAVALLLPVLGLFWLSQLGAHAGFLHDILVPSALAGLGFGLSYVPLTMAATAGGPAEQAGLASGLITSARQIGGAFGLAAMATVAAAATRHHHASARHRPRDRLRPGVHARRSGHAGRRRDRKSTATRPHPHTRARPHQPHAAARPRRNVVGRPVRAGSNQVGATFDATSSRGPLCLCHPEPACDHASEIERDHPRQVRFAGAQ